MSYQRTLHTIQCTLHSVLPSWSAIQDLDMIADLFEKMLLNWSLLYLNRPLFGLTPVQYGCLGPEAGGHQGAGGTHGVFDVFDWHQGQRSTEEVGRGVRGQ